VVQPTQSCTQDCGASRRFARLVPLFLRHGRNPEPTRKTYPNIGSACSNDYALADGRARPCADVRTGCIGHRVFCADPDPRNSVYADTDYQPHLYACAGTDCHPRTDADTKADRNAYTDTDMDGHCHTRAHLYLDAHTHGYADTDSGRSHTNHRARGL
jgi:hypothetical protein